MYENDVYVGLGSNLNDPVRPIALAIEALKNLPETSLKAVSSLYQSPLVGPVKGQLDVINAVAHLVTNLSPETLLSALLNIENQQGRVRHQHGGSRSLDLDLLLYNKEVIETPSLVVPHPRMKARAFVLYPLAEIAPELILPSGERVEDVLTRCDELNLTKLQRSAL